MELTQELKPRVMREPRVVSPGVRIWFDDEVRCRIVFADEPNVPAVIPDGTIIRMQAPITLKGGFQKLRLLTSPSAQCANGKLTFENGRVIPLSKIRGENWGEVIEVPCQI